jgi:hypothetical protein
MPICQEFLCLLDDFPLACRHHTSIDAILCRNQHSRRIPCHQAGASCRCTTLCWRYASNTYDPTLVCKALAAVARSTRALPVANRDSKFSFGAQSSIGDLCWLSYQMLRTQSLVRMPFIGSIPHAIMTGMLPASAMDLASIESAPGAVIGFLTFPKRTSRLYHSNDVPACVLPVGSTAYVLQLQFLTEQHPSSRRRCRQNKG